MAYKDWKGSYTKSFTPSNARNDNIYGSKHDINCHLDISKIAFDIIKVTIIPKPILTHEGSQTYQMQNLILSKWT